MGINKFLITLSLFSTILFSAQAKLSMGTYNIRNFDYDERSNTPTNKSHLLNTLTEMNTDLLAVQEITKINVFRNFIQSNFSNRELVLTNCGGSHGQKLGFVYNSNKLELISFNEDLRTVNPNHPGSTGCEGSRPLAIAKFKLKETNEVLIAIALHLKSGGRIKSIQKRFSQLNILSVIVNDFQKQGFKNIVIMGDFNSTEYTHKGREYKRFRSVVSKMNMIDLTQNIACTSYWWGGQRDGMQHPSILDHVLVSENLAFNKEARNASPLAHCQKLKCEITSEVSMGVSFNEVSDHCPIITEIN